MNYWIEQLDIEIGFIFEHEESFCQKFCKIFPPESVPELYGVWFSADNIKINYCDMSSGQHFSDVIDIDQYFEWRKSLK